MRKTYMRVGLQLTLGLLLMSSLSACGSDNSNGQTVAVNLSLAVNTGQAQNSSSRLLAWMERWLPGATQAWAQTVSEIASIQVQVSGPGIASPATTTVPVSNPTSGQEISVSIQAPVGPNRTITVSAFNAASPPLKIFGGTLPGVNLTAGAPINLEITLVRAFMLTVIKDGTGRGGITSSPLGISCGTTCSGQFDDGTSVTLNPSPDPGSMFVSWGGACSGTNPCVVLMTGNATVTATFNTSVVATTHLHVDRTGTGTGTVTSAPIGIDCGTDCDNEFPRDSRVTLTALPDAGSFFTGWSGGTCSTTNPCDVFMNGDQTVTAIFTAFVPIPMSLLTVQKIGSGSGTVTSNNQAGISCGSACSASFPTNSLVTLTASPATGSTFIGWSNGCTGAGSCDVTLTGDQTIVAQFDLLPDLVTLSVNTSSGPGEGTVTSDQGGISCPSACTASFTRGTTVTLTAAPIGPSVFVGWGEGPCEAVGTAPCVITMNDNITANARFERLGD